MVYRELEEAFAQDCLFEGVSSLNVEQAERIKHEWEKVNHIFIQEPLGVQHGLSWVFLYEKPEKTGEAQIEKFNIVTLRCALGDKLSMDNLRRVFDIDKEKRSGRYVVKRLLENGKQGLTDLLGKPVTFRYFIRSIFDKEPNFKWDREIPDENYIPS